MYKAIYRYLYVGLFYIILFTTHITSYAQNPAAINSILEGIILDETTGFPLEGANIQIEGVPNQTSTDAKGKFTLKTGQKFPYNIIISFVGYQKKIVLVDGSPVTIGLHPETNQLDDVVVVGYGTQRKQDLTGSVTSLSVKDFNKGTHVSLDNLIAGKAAGVQITQSSSEPGAGVTIRIRGANSINASNEPLYVIDGLPIDNTIRIPTSAIVNESAPRNPLNALNPSDIASIEILKDASATAIYGSRGANGVILITTKRGTKGRLTIEYNTSGAVQRIAKKIPMLSTSEYINLLNDLKKAQGQAPEFSEEEIQKIGEGVNWQDAIFRSGYTQNHQLNLSGGKDKFSYYTSLSFLDQTGIIISSGIKRFSARTNFNYSDTKIKFGINLNASKIKDDYVPNGVSINESAGIVNTALFQDPTLPFYNENGKYAQSTLVNLENPLSLAHGVSDNAIIAYLETDVKPNIGKIVYEYANKLKKKSI